CGRRTGLAAEDRVHDRSENTHRLLPIYLQMPWGVSGAFVGPAAPDRGSQCDSTPQATGLPMRQSPKLEQDNDRNRAYVRLNSLRHGQFGFLCVWSDRDRFAGTAQRCPSRGTGLRPLPPWETTTMATPYQGNVTNVGGADAAGEPVVRTIGIS